MKGLIHLILSYGRIFWPGWAGAVVVSALVICMDFVDGPTEHNLALVALAVFVGSQIATGALVSKSGIRDARIIAGQAPFCAIFMVILGAYYLISFALH